MSCGPLIVGTPDIYWAPVGEAFPDVDDTPAGNWVKIGTNGNRNYSEDGVVVDTGDETEEWYSAGSLWPECITRTRQNLMVRVTVHDMTFEHLRLAFNLNTVTTDAGPPAIKTISLDMGTSINEMALLIRGTAASPYDNALNLQFELYRVVVVGSRELPFTKETPVGYELEFKALKDSNGLVGNIDAQTA